MLYEVITQQYKSELKTFKKLQSEHKELLIFQAEAIKEHDYNSSYNFV